MERYTSDLRVPYFVKSDFLKQYKGSIHRVEQQVEEDYISNLRMGCYRERSQSNKPNLSRLTRGGQNLYGKFTWKNPEFDKVLEQKLFGMVDLVGLGLI